MIVRIVEMLVELGRGTARPTACITSMTRRHSGSRSAPVRCAIRRVERKADRHRFAVPQAVLGQRSSLCAAQCP